MAQTAEQIIALLGLEPHVEGGYFRQTFADTLAPGGRPYSTLIYYMLTDCQAGTWHRVDAAEVWHYYAGSPTRLRISLDGRSVIEQILGNDLAAGQRPQVVVPRGAWQEAAVLGEWGLVGCTVAPGFDFMHFEQKAKGWQPG